MDHRVFLALAFAKIPENFNHVGVFKQIDHVVHGPADCIWHVHPCNLGKQLAQKWICLRQIERGHLAGKFFIWRRMDSGGKQAIGQCLSEHVGELLFVEFRNQRFAECGQPIMKPAVFFLVLERIDDQIANYARHARHAPGQFLGRSDS